MFDVTFSTNFSGILRFHPLLVKIYYLYKSTESLALNFSTIVSLKGFFSRRENEIVNWHQVLNSLFPSFYINADFQSETLFLVPS